MDTEDTGNNLFRGLLLRVLCVSVVESSIAYLKRSSNALRALVGAASPLGDAGVLVWRSMVVRGEKSVQLFRSSFGATRAVSFAFSVHSHRALVSNDTHWMQLCKSTPHFEQRSSVPIGSDNRFPQRAHRQTSCAAIRFGVFGPRSS